MTTQAQQYLDAMEEMDRTRQPVQMPKPAWRRYYGANGKYELRVATPRTTVMILGFEDGSRVRNERGGEITAV